MAGECRVGVPWTVLTGSTNPTDLVVVGSHGLGRARSRLVGSVTNEVAERATCPVVVVRWPRQVSSTRSHRGVVVGVDRSDESIEAAGFAFAAAAERGLPLTVVHVVWEPLADLSLADRHGRASGDDPLDFADAVADWKDRYPDVSVDVRYESGPPAQVLVDASAESDLLVVGSHSRATTSGLLLGSVSREVLQRAGCAVAVVRGQTSQRSLHRRQPVGG